MQSDNQKQVQQYEKILPDDIETQMQDKPYT